MSSNKQIIDGALRRLGVLGGHGQSAQPDDYANALQTLASLFKSLISRGAFGRLKDVIPPFSAGLTEYQAGENERVYRNSTDAGQIVSLTDIITDRCGNPRPVHDLAVVSIQDRQSGNSVDYIFDGGRKQWFALDDLANADSSDATALAGLLAQECPLSNRDAAGLSSYLALHIADDFGSQLPPATQKIAQNFIQGLTHNYSGRQQERDEDRPSDYGRRCF